MLASQQAGLELRRGDNAAALAAAECAVAIADASPQRAVYLPLLLQRRSEVFLASDMAASAVADVERAVSLEITAAGESAVSAHVGERYLALGRALEALGESARAHEAYEKALSHLERSLGAGHPWARAARERAAAAVGG